MRVIPHSHTLTVRVSMAWTISRPLDLHVCVGAWVVGPHTDCCCCSCIPVKSMIVTWHHYNTDAVQGHHWVKAVHKLWVDNHALSMHWSTLLIHHWLIQYIPSRTVLPPCSSHIHNECLLLMCLFLITSSSPSIIWGWKLDSLVYSFVADTIGLSLTTFMKLVPKLPNSVEKRKLAAIMPFKVTQGHRFWYQSKAHVQLLVKFSLSTDRYLSLTHLFGVNP